MEVLVAEAEPVPHSKAQTNDLILCEGSQLISRRSEEAT
jgi:hypothetical protein